jgi:CHAT domain-containing protein
MREVSVSFVCDNVVPPADLREGLRMELQRYSGSRVRFSSGRTALFCGATVLVLGLAGLFLRTAGREDPHSRGGFGQGKETRGHGSVEGRLSGESTSALALPEAYRELRAGREGQAALLKDLIAQEPARAVTFLERATRESPRDPRMLSDLSVAYLARAGRERRPEDLARALSAALQASRLSPLLPEAAFNRALAMEKLSLKGAAIRAWEAYPELDPVSEWSAEAEKHRQVLARPAFWQSWEATRRRLDAAAETQDVAVVREIVRRYPQPAREYAETEVLGRWGDDIAAGDVIKAERTLWLAGALGEAVVEVTGDLMMRDVVATIRRAAADPAGDRLGLLVRGHRAYREGRNIYESFRCKGSAAPMESAREALERGNSSLAAWPALYRAACAYMEGSYGAALDEFERLGRDAERRRHPILLGHAEWMSGLLLSNQGRLGESLERYHRALDLFEKTRQAQSAATIHELLASTLDRLGDRREAWVHLSRALAAEDRILKRSWLVTILRKVADFTLQMDLLETSLAFHDEAVRVALQAGKPLTLGEAFVSRALGRHRLGDEEGALQDLEEAQLWVLRADDEALKAAVQARLDIVKGKILRKTEPARAIAALDSAQRLFLARGAKVQWTEGYLERGRANLALGRDDAAEADFAAGIGDFEASRRSILKERLRISYFEQAREVFDEMIRLQIEQRHDPQRALEVSEQARARELLDRLTGGGGPSPVLALREERVLQRLSAERVLVHYAVLEDRTLAWVLAPGGIKMFEQRIRAEDLQRRVREFNGAIQRQAEEDRVQPLGAGLYDLLIRPLAGSLPQEATLVFIPDKVLHELPFAALYDAAAGRYLVEDHPIAVAPSAALLLHGLRVRGDAGFEPLEALRPLIVGSPLVDAQAFPSLTSLPGAEKEMNRVAALYPQAETLTGPGATKSRFLEEVGRHEIVHFAGHAISNEEFPLLSMLVLAPETGSAGALMAHEIYGLKLERTRLVVLAACSTARARISPGEGVLGLARPFLAAGVPSVVGSLWKVDDRTNPVFFEAFYRRLRDRASPVAALRAAQLELLQGQEPAQRSPAAWAAFEVIMGGGL